MLDRRYAREPLSLTPADRRRLTIASRKAESERLVGVRARLREFLKAERVTLCAYDEEWVFINSENDAAVSVNLDEES